MGVGRNGLTINPPVKTVMYVYIEDTLYRRRCAS